MKDVAGHSKDGKRWNRYSYVGSVDVYDMTGNLMGSFRDSTTAADNFGVSTSCIRMCKLHGHLLLRKYKVVKSESNFADGDLLLANFLGLTKIKSTWREPGEKKRRKGFPGKSSNLNLGWGPVLNFKKNWNQIIKVVHKINEIHPSTNEPMFEHHEFWNLTLFQSTIEEVYAGCLNYVRWYYSRKK